MKRIMSFLLIGSLILFSTFACAESTTDDAARIAELEALVANLQAQIEVLTATPAPTPEPTPAPYKELAKGSKGDAVVVLQDRLKELGYLSGKSDGAYGNGTASAVKEFQKTAGVEETGTADVNTLALLYADDAPASLNPVFDTSAYETLDYKSNSRDPDAYAGTKIKFSGKIAQVSEGDYSIVFRISSKGSYDDVVYCTYYPPENYKRFLEDDRVNVYGTSTGIYTYTTIMGGSVTIPSCTIDRIELK